MAVCNRCGSKLTVSIRDFCSTCGKVNLCDNCASLHKYEIDHEWKNIFAVEDESSD